MQKNGIRWNSGARNSLHMVVCLINLLMMCHVTAPYVMSGFCRCSRVFGPSEYWLNSDALFINLVFLVPGLVSNSNSEYLCYFGQTLLDLLLLGPDVTCFFTTSSLVSMWFEYSGVLLKWEHFIQMRMVHFCTPLFWWRESDKQEALIWMKKSHRPPQYLTS